MAIFPLLASTLFFFFNDTATTEIYTLSLHDALPILHDATRADDSSAADSFEVMVLGAGISGLVSASVLLKRSEEHTSELQSHSDLVCRLLLEKKNAHLIAAVLHRHAVIIKYTRRRLA